VAQRQALVVASVTICHARIREGGQAANGSLQCLWSDLVCYQSKRCRPRADFIPPAVSSSLATEYLLRPHIRSGVTGVKCSTPCVGQGAAFGVLLLWPGLVDSPKLPLLDTGAATTHDRSM
jgi:hypothetical protein